MTDAKNTEENVLTPEQAKELKAKIRAAEEAAARGGEQPAETEGQPAETPETLAPYGEDLTEEEEEALALEEAKLLESVGETA